MSQCMSDITQKERDNKCWQGCRKKETYVHGQRDCELVQPLGKTVWSLFKKLKIKYHKQSLPQRDTCTLISASFTIANVWKQPKHLSADEWIEKM